MAILKAYERYTRIAIFLHRNVQSCIRFKKIDQIPFELIGRLAGKMSAKEWINIYESSIKG